MARLRAGLDDAAVLEEQVRLEHGGDADASLETELAHGGEAVARAEDPVGDERRQVAREVLVQVRGVDAHPVRIARGAKSTVMTAANCAGRSWTWLHLL